MSAAAVSLEERLALVREAPVAIERAIASALADAVRWRCGGGRGPAAGTFAAAAVASLRADSPWLRRDAATRLRMVRTTDRVARSFARSRLGRRLMAMPSDRLVGPCGDGASPVAVRDASGRIHVVALTARRAGLELGELATAVANGLALPAGEGLRPVSVHCYSLATNRHVRFERAAPARRGAGGASADPRAAARPFEPAELAPPGRRLAPPPRPRRVLAPASPASAATAPGERRVA